MQDTYRKMVAKIRRLYSEHSENRAIYRTIGPEMLRSSPGSVI